MDLTLIIHVSVWPMQWTKSCSGYQLWTLVCSWKWPLNRWKSATVICLITTTVRYSQSAQFQTSLLIFSYYERLCFLNGYKSSAVLFMNNFPIIYMFSGDCLKLKVKCRIRWAAILWIESSWRKYTKNVLREPA